MTDVDGVQTIELPSGRAFHVGRSRWDGPLDAEELAYCRANGIEVGYDPAQVGWVVMTNDGDEHARPPEEPDVHAEVERAATELALQVAGATRGGGAFDVVPAIRAVETRLLADLDLHLADRLHWLLTHRVMTAVDGAGTPPAPGSADDVSFRAWDESDVQLHRALLDDEQVWEHLPDAYPTPYTDETSLALIAVSNARAGHDVVAVAIDGAVVGQCLLRIEPERAGPTAGEVAYWLGSAFWGQGMMGRVLPRFVGRCFELHDVDILHAWIRPDNAASLRVAERVGFRRDPFVREEELARATGRAGFERWALHRPRESV